MTSQLTARHLLRARDLADARYREPLTVADLASTAGLSQARGVGFSEPPTEQPYGIDTSFRDPSGNNIRLTQILEFDPARGAGL